MTKLQHLTACLFLVLTSACASADEKEIRGILAQVETSFEAKDFERVTDHVADDYSDNLKQKRERIPPTLQRHFGYYERVEAKVSVQKIEISGVSAKVVTRIIVDGFMKGRKERVFGAPFIAKPMEIYFEKRTGTWWLVGSHI